MARNPERRTLLADAAVRVMAQHGSRGLTHRAIDKEAQVPAGTASNYFNSRDAIIQVVLNRIGDRLAPNPQVHAELARQPASAELFASYLRDIVNRLTTDRDATLALFELRLEAARHSGIAATMHAWRQAGLEADVEFNTRMKLPGARRDTVLFHYALDGLILDHITVPLDEEANLDDTVNMLVKRLLPTLS